MCSRVWHPPDRPGAGCFLGMPSAGRELGSSGMTSSCASHAPHLAVSQAASLHVVCCCHVEFHVLCGSSVNGPLWWIISLATGCNKHFAVGTPVSGTRPPQAVPNEQVELDKAQRRGKKGCTLFYTQILFVFLRNSQWGLPVTIGRVVYIEPPAICQFQWQSSCPSTSSCRGFCLQTSALTWDSIYLPLSLSSLRGSRLSWILPSHLLWIQDKLLIFQSFGFLLVFRTEWQLPSSWHAEVKARSTSSKTCTC